MEALQPKRFPAGTAQRPHDRARIDYSGVPEAVPRCGDGTAYVERTAGDGKCAIRSVAGQRTGNQLFHHNASEFVRNALGTDAAVLASGLMTTTCFANSGKLFGKSS